MLVPLAVVTPPPRRLARSLAIAAVAGLVVHAHRADPAPATPPASTIVDAPPWPSPVEHSLNDVYPDRTGSCVPRPADEDFDASEFSSARYHDESNEDTGTRMVLAEGKMGRVDGGRAMGQLTIRYCHE